MSETAPPPSRRTQSWPSVVALATGLGYGLLVRLAFQADEAPEWVVYSFAAMSLAFLFLAPLGLGGLTVYVGQLRGPRSVPYWIFMPWLPTLLLLLGTGVLAWEGTICLVMAAPIFFGMASLGGALMGVLRQVRERRTGGAATALAVLPLVFAPVEQRLPEPHALRSVETVTTVQADAAAVWAEIVRVPEIRPEEQRPSPFHWIGIPRPLEARLDHERLGGVREALFHGGIRFREEITEWEPERVLGFNVEVDPQSVEPVLDPHVRVGGPYFDVVYGRFLIEPRGPGEVRLRLESRHRLSTRFNAYAGLWTDAVMRDLQEGICRVVKARAERR